MNTSIKNIMGVAIIFAVTLFGIGIYDMSQSYADSRDQSTNRSFAVSAEGKAIAVPDVARFTYAIVSEGGTDVAGLQEENTKKSNAVMSYVKDEGVAKEDIRTIGYSVYPQYTYSSCDRGGSCPPPSISGYSVRHEVEVRVRDFDKVGALLGGVVQKGANTVSQVSFTVDDPTAAETKAKEEAVKKALEKAKSLAKAGGFSVGDILGIDEAYPVSPYPMYAKSSLGMAEGAVSMDVGVPVPDIAPGSEEVVRSVTVRFSIK